MSNEVIQKEKERQADKVQNQREAAVGIYMLKQGCWWGTTSESRIKTEVTNQDQPGLQM